MTTHPFRASTKRLRFMDAGSDRARLPVAVLSGFLGSGKTTLVNALLRDPRLADTAVAVNEFGDVPLDQHLVEDGSDRTVVLANGCLCCNLAGDMEAGVMRLFSRRESGTLPRFKRLIVEPSGLADPAPIVQAILRNPVMSKVLRLEAIVATVDCVFAEAQLARHPETRKQVALAERIVLTKPDLAGPETVARVRALVRRHNPVAPIEVALDGAVDAGWLLPARFLDADAGDDALTPMPARPMLVADAAEHGVETRAVSLVADAPLRWREFEAWLRGLRLGHAEGLLRLKAMLDIEGATGPVVLHGVHHVLHTPVQLEHWPDADHRSRIVLITQGVADGALRSSWDAALPGLLAT